MPEPSTAVQFAFALAAAEAKNLESRYIDVEHMFLALCKMEDVLEMKVPQDLPEGITPQEFKKVVDETRELKKILEKAELDTRGARRRLRRIVYDSDEDRGEFTGHRTPRCRKLFEEAERVASANARDNVGLTEMFIAVLTQESPDIDRLLSELDVDKGNLLEKMGGEGIKSDTYDDAPVEEKQQGGRTPNLEKYGRDLTALAREGKLEPIIGRKAEIKKLARTLLRKKKANAILLGEAGVGKTCIVEGLAQELIKPDLDPRLSSMRLIELSAGSMVAGTKYRGEFEERMEYVLKEAISNPGIVIFIDEIHSIMGAGTSESGGPDIANMIKPALQGALKVIGATTTSEYRRYIEKKDPALARRFENIYVNEPTRDEAVQILKGLSEKFSEFHNVEIPDEVIEKAVDLSMRYITDFRLPDKAIDIIDYACAAKTLKTFSAVGPMGANPTLVLEVDDIAEVISERCRIPVSSLTADESKRLRKMDEQLKKRVMGQDQAVKKLSDAVRNARLGLKAHPEKPVVFMFLGATGTGKTELAKALAEYLFFDEKKLITFDMSQYQSEHTVSNLIGSPRGYIGSEDEGELIARVRTNPYSVVLFDEIEKAHEKIFDIFIPMMDEGRLTDAQGRRAMFSETIIVMTSNLGGSLTPERPIIGIPIPDEKKGKAEDGSTQPSVTPEADWGDYESRIMATIEKTFRPEFIGRIGTDRMVIFYPLGPETIELIMDKVIANHQKLLSEKHITLAVSKDARKFIIERGFNQQYGARPLEQTFERCVIDHLSEMMIEGKLEAGQTVKASAGKDELRFKVS